MLCPSCNIFRPVNNAPCPRCNAPSPLVGETGNGYQAPSASATWGSSIAPPAGRGWANVASQGSFQREVNNNTLRGQVMPRQAVTGSIEQQQTSLLPVPFQAGIAAPQSALKVMSPNVPTIHTGGQEGALIPAIPGEEGPIYVPPMYTKPRAIIPRYRIISGLLSVFIVFALLCTGATYYARATGKLAFLHIIYGDARPNNLVTTSAKALPIPQKATEYGPASVIINSATTASKIDTATAQPLAPTNQFKVGDTIYLTYSVHPKAPGTVLARWYTNNNFYQQSMPMLIKDAASGYIPIQYVQPVEGRVELYWNDQLAIRLFFVVEPAGS